MNTGSPSAAQLRRRKNKKKERLNQEVEGNKFVVFQSPGGEIQFGSAEEKEVANERPITSKLISSSAYVGHP